MCLLPKGSSAHACHLGCPPSYIHDLITREREGQESQVEHGHQVATEEDLDTVLELIEDEFTNDLKIVIIGNSRMKQQPKILVVLLVRKLASEYSRKDFN